MRQTDTQARPGKERQFRRVARCQSPEGETCQREVWFCSDTSTSHECCFSLGLYLDTYNSGSSVHSCSLMVFLSVYLQQFSDNSQHMLRSLICWLISGQVRILTEAKYFL